MPWVARKASLVSSPWPMPIHPLALKANHGGLHQRAEEFFNRLGRLQPTKRRGGTLSTTEVSNPPHRRIERRVVLATDRPWWIDKLERENWSDLRSVICVESHREQFGSGEKSMQKCYCHDPP